MPGRQQEGTGPQEDRTACGSVSVYGGGVSSRLSLASRSDTGFFLAVHVLLCRDGCQQEGFWEVVGHMASPFDLPVFVQWGLVSSVFLTGISYHIIGHTTGYYGSWPGGAVSASVFPLTVPQSKRWVGSSYRAP